MRGSIILAALLVGCYGPSVTPYLPCSDTGHCPDGQSCNPFANKCEPGSLDTASFASITAGDRHTCGIAPDRTLWCWGANETGQLGTGDTEDATVLAPVGDADDWTSVDAGVYHTCGIRDPGTLWCWGEDVTGGAIAVAPRQIGVDDDWLEVSAGGGFTCGIRAGDQLWCWGANAGGQVGDGTDDVVVTEPHEIDGDGSGWRHVSTSVYAHTCAIDVNGGLWCWGYDGDNQLGDGSGTSGARGPSLIEPSGWTDVVAGARYSCGLRGAELECWGNELVVSSDVPLAMDPGVAWTTISAGYAHLCGVRDDGSAWCTGTGEAGELGAAAAVDSVLVPVVGDAHWTAIAAGADHTCGILDDQTTWCWGSNDRGQLGRGVPGRELVPEQIGDATDWSAIAAGDLSTCGIRGGGDLYCWGWNGMGQLGDGTTDQQAEPRAIQVGTRRATAITSGYAHTCAIDEDDHLWCWGSNDGGELGLGTETAPVLVPTQVGDAEWIAIDAHGRHTCGIQAPDGSLWCWGEGREDSPAIASGSIGWSSVTTLDNKFIDAVQADHDHYAWSYFDSTPEPSSPVDSITAYSAGNGGHACWVTTAGTMLCAGDNDHGELGNGMIGAEADGVDVIGGPWRHDSPGSIGLGDQHSCASDDAGATWCWGANESGQLGDGTIDERHAPVPVAGPEMTVLTGGSRHTCGIDGGALWCWGSNSNGQLGDGNGGSAVPTEITR